ncbi:uncharacterized protein LOC111697859 [Eurytemora carolleeae]|uniref:uncharacterized protein LOC111697859 n=1 Tax=Eurytemora carolleeae TaxID=1294199 RepID=UPI000C785B6D|nr:uncharacterized protein LOC111697859 [Eurytemora carolleeae]|eukprot:XP_023323762.1 uncharacterized protein LOC111697859 [Eurytemora affinis]
MLHEFASVYEEFQDLLKKFSLDKDKERKKRIFLKVLEELTKKEYFSNPDAKLLNSLIRNQLNNLNLLNTMTVDDKFVQRYNFILTDLVNRQYSTPDKNKVLMKSNKNKTMRYKPENTPHATHLG